MKKTTTVLLVLALAIALFSAKAAYADTAAGSVGITNAAPTVGIVTLYNQANVSAAITLTAGSTVTVVANATITDLNGGDNIASASGVLYGANVSEVDNENTRITNSSCILGATAGNTKFATCAFTINYMALPGTWTANIIASDGTATGSAEGTNTVNSLAALDVTDTTISFSTLALGANSSSATTMTVQNLGNVQIDSIFSGTNYTCTIGEVPATNTKYGLVSANYDTLTTGLTEAAVTQTGFDLTYRTGGTNSTKSEYWGILIPTSGVSGTCTDTLTVTAIAG